ncbi:hypothetical protein IGI65_001422 [Enterococcus sp. DIV0755b]|uniref:DUF2304 domain-containing protein n=1 Tax=Enterococcus sp. DIV0755b TaxID=2774657 RepID=UPI003F2927EA
MINIFSIMMVIIALLFLYFIIRNINTNRFLLENAAIWIAFGIIWVVFSLFPKIPAAIANLFGFQITSNFLMFSAIIFLLYLVFRLSIKLSRQQSQLNTLIQEISILKSKKEK